MSVYFAQREEGGLIKIGWSQSVSARMWSLGAKLLGAIPGDRSVEAITHKKFEHLRVQGEWFTPSGELLEYIRTQAQRHVADTERIQTAIRLPESLLGRVKDLIPNMSLSGIRATEVGVLRIAMHKGLSQLERELQQQKYCAPSVYAGKQIQKAIRVSTSMMSRMDEIAATMSQPGARVTRSEVMRLVLCKGIDQIKLEISP